MKLEGMLAMTISVILTFVCYTDIRYRKITNATTLLIFSLSLLLTFHHLEECSLPLLLLLFGVGFVFSIVGVIGAGDVKLVCALSTGLSTTDIGNFLFLMGMTGIPLTLLTCLYYKLFSKNNVITIPYGVAICSGYWLLWAV
ncbi:A24 family peptidase [Candidatus Symbiopectobacterium sp. NZEC135]|uniref:A24 family peptidase n=1 Tax=Candidatus Symbiopectobacterium sp. NZEC135 TaxID=2820471 RepID=UPI0022265B8B|nr:A24 family peptidase [Candidatus Symbiopectobacterium sp. NZEC135]